MSECYSLAELLHLGWSGVLCMQAALGSTAWVIIVVRGLVIQAPSCRTLQLTRVPSTSKSNAGRGGDARGQHDLGRLQPQMPLAAVHHCQRLRCQAALHECHESSRTWQPCSYDTQSSTEGSLAQLVYKHEVGELRGLMSWALPSRAKQGRSFSPTSRQLHGCEHSMKQQIIKCLPNKFDEHMRLESSTLPCNGSLHALWWLKHSAPAWRGTRMPACGSGRPRQPPPHPLPSRAATPDGRAGQGPGPQQGPPPVRPRAARMAASRPPARNDRLCVPKYVPIFITLVCIASACVSLVSESAKCWRLLANQCPVNPQKQAHLQMRTTVRCVVAATIERTLLASLQGRKITLHRRGSSPAMHARTLSRARHCSRAHSLWATMPPASTRADRRGSTGGRHSQRPYTL